MSDFQLHVAGKKYSAWETLQVTRSLEQLADSFSLTLSERWAGENSQLPVAALQACRVTYDGRDVITGWIDEDLTTYDARAHTITATGRSLTGDLVDCAAVHRGGQWRGKDLQRIAEDLCDPFGVAVVMNTDVGAAFRLFELQDGETVFQALGRACRRRGVLLRANESGALVLDRVGSTKVRTSLEYGRNILRGQKRNSVQDRFSTYTVKAQTQGTDNLFGLGASGLKRVSTDVGVTRYRPTILPAEDEDSGGELQKRADWERNVRAGRAKRVDYTVQGWEHQDGLWAPNTLVTVRDSVLRVDDELLVVSVNFVRSETDGTITNLSLTLPEAFDVQPLPPAKKESWSLF